MPGSQLIPWLLLQSRERRESAPRQLLPAWRLEHRPRLARIGIDPEDQEFGRDCTEIDGSINQWFRFLAIATGADLYVGTRRAWRFENQIQGFGDLILDW